MGVDYSAVFGIGVKITSFPDEVEDVYEFMDDTLDGTDFRWGESGEGAYSGEENDFYIFINQPFENGIDGLTAKAIDLIEFVKGKGLTTTEVDVVGGLHIW